MLVIISGSGTINKQLFRKRAIEALNTFDVDDFKVKFDNHGFSFFDKTGKIVFPDPGNDPMHPFPEQNQVSFQKMLALQQQVFHDTATTKVHQCRNVFVDLTADYGVTTPTFANQLSGGNLATTYNDVISQYNARTYETLVITGSFSKVFIDRIRQDLGESNVAVVNITRNPSVAYMLELLLLKAGISVDPGCEKITQSFITCASVARDTKNNTVKFEDILANGALVINGTSIPLIDEQSPYNKYLTKWEYDTLVNSSTMQDSDLYQYNQLMTDWVANTPATNNNPAFPRNIFTLLGYSPLTISQITAK
jgi:hypothetical protein